MDADNRQAGPELDKLIAEKVFGYVDVHINMLGRMWVKDKKSDDCRHTLPGDGRFSTDISAAWEVVEKMKEKDFWWSSSFKSGIFKANINKPGHEVEFRRVKLGINDEPHDYVAIAETLPLAICLAALSASEGK